MIINKKDICERKLDTVRSENNDRHFLIIYGAGPTRRMIYQMLIERGLLLRVS